MYITITETAEYLGMHGDQVTKYVLEGRIRAVHDGEQFMINRNQFELYFKQLEIAKQQIADWLNEPLPPDRDIKDED